MAPSIPVYSSSLVLSSSNKVSVSKSRHRIIGGTLFHYTTIFYKMGFCKLNSNAISFHKDGYSKSKTPYEYLVAKELYLHSVP
jgi:hypothetical protein